MKKYLLKSGISFLVLGFMAACTTTHNSKPQKAEVEFEQSETEVATTDVLDTDDLTEASFDSDVGDADSDSEVDVATATEDLDVDSGDWNEDYQ